MTEAAFNGLLEAMHDTLEAGGGVLELAIAAARALGYAVPKEILMDQKSYRRSVTIYPQLPWSPFELRI